MPRKVRELQRGEIYGANFPYTFDRRFPHGKFKFVVVLQSGEYFSEYNATVVLLLTSNVEGKDLNHVVEIPKGTTLLPETSYVECSQPFTIKKEIFYDSRVKFKGKLSFKKLEEIDDLGLCMGQQGQDAPIKEEKEQEQS